MQVYTGPITRLIEEFSKLPGVGRKTAQRLAFHIINMNTNDVEALSKAIIEAKREIKYCSVCCNITDTDPCSMCSNKNRDSSVICVVEDPRDVAAMERTREFKGQYHVLNGVIAPASENSYQFVIRNHNKFNIKYSLEFIEENKYNINMKILTK